ncbi:bifunctional diaminohydroxyphosphoribosylaminopyrimidine deaminase/5-amino-6-(5-phosphoribosylamino)uracil reductase RibD [Colwellia psychrerythraea]|uniref:Riboflavin biosynthesis protein RibD n=1 Tax=Colwellia psychrerythraea TaxID=28229 RepID=A0A099KYI0_COLPS|nr:bifunctional diaminohydroxyphosphoribosylaminopyrimidine deaminase/5-amino-6-(5-phosphoribosylamino)uracil reductase RibD [Colwellia psychrerythraea]KGJ94927.1 riboflavin biosynthesis protein RibD [Colwellia psychrerythraea]
MKTTIADKKNFTDQDHIFMARAIELAKKGHFTTSPNPRVGCVLVNYKNGIGKIIGEGYHQKAGQGHAEVKALIAAKINYAFLIKGATAYVTLEPCSHFGRTPPCAQALVDAGVKHVIAAMVDPDQRVSGNGLALLEKAGIKTQSGLLEQSARVLNIGFIHHRESKLPYVRCKLAASLDGKTAMASGESKWITSSAARQDVQRLRAQSCAIISGADSIIFDNAKMTVRWSQLGDLKNSYPEEILRQPLRVVIDSQNRLTPNLAIFEHESPILVINGIVNANNAKVENKLESDLENLPKWPHFVEHVQLPVIKNSQGNSKIDLRSLLALLAKRDLNDVLIESGANLSGAFIEQDLVNELILYQAPKLMGGDGKNLVAMPAITKLNKAKELAISDLRMVGADIRITSQLITNKQNIK